MPGPEGRFLVVGINLRTPIDYAREMDRAMNYYAHVYACLAEVADPSRRAWLINKPHATLEELAARGDEGAAIEIERRRWKSHLDHSTEMAARAGVRLNVPAFDPDRPLGPGSMVRWAQQGPLDYAGRLDPRMDKFALGEWVDSTLPATPGGLLFTETDKLPWHDERVPDSGREAELALAQWRAGVEEPIIDPPRTWVPEPTNGAAPTEGWKKVNEALKVRTDGRIRRYNLPKREKGGMFAKERDPQGKEKGKK